MFFSDYFAKRRERQQEEIRQQMTWVEESIARRTTIADTGERLLSLNEFKLTLIDQYGVLAKKFRNSLPKKMSEAAKGLGMFAGGFFAVMGMAALVTAVVAPAALSTGGFLGVLALYAAAFTHGILGGYKLVGLFTDRYAEKHHAEVHEGLFSAIDHGLEKIETLKKDLIGLGLPAFAGSPFFNEVRRRFPQLSERFTDAALGRDAKAPQAAPSADIKITLVTQSGMQMIDP